METRGAQQQRSNADSMTSVVAATSSGVELNETERYLTMMYQKILGRVNRGDPKPTLQIQSSIPRCGAVPADAVASHTGKPIARYAASVQSMQAKNSELSTITRTLRRQQNARQVGMRAWITNGGDRISRTREVRRKTRAGTIKQKVTFRLEPVMKKVPLTPTWTAKNVIADTLVDMRAALASAGVSTEFDETTLDAWRASGLHEVLAKAVSSKIKAMQREGALKKIEDKIVMHA